MTGGSRKPRAAARRHVGSRGFAVADARVGHTVVVRSRTPLVGRVAERERLRFAAVSAAKGRPHAVLITGPTGIGKSRVLEEAASLASQRGLEPVMLDCAYSGVGDFASLRPLARRWASQRDEYWAAPGTSRAEQAAAWVAKIAAEARRGPLVLCLDDVHGADGATVIAIRHLFRWCDENKISVGTKLLVVVTAADPTLLALDVPRLDRREDSPLGLVNLQPLPGLETVELVRQFGLGDVPRAAAETVAERCEGNPLTARVVTDLLLSSSQLGPSSHDRHFALAEELVGLPRSPVGLIERQFDELDAATRRVLAAVSTMDAGAPAGWLDELTGEDDPTIEHALETAARLGVIEVGDTIRFTHPLGRERARSELAARELEALHVRLAHFVRGANGSPTLEVVEHLRRAGTLVAPQDLFDEAVDAGRLAAKRCEWDSAARCLQLASDTGRKLVSVDDRALAALAHEAAKALQAAGEVVGARRWAERAAERAEAAGDRETYAAAILTAVRCRIWAGSFGDSIDVDGVTEVARDVRVSPARRAEAGLVASEAAWMAGNSMSCLLWSAEAYREAESVGAADLCAQALVSNATGHWLRLSLDDALDQLRAASAWGALVRTPTSTAIAEGRLALTYWWLGATERAMQCSETALAAADRASTPLERAIPLTASAAISACRGDHERALSGTAEAELLSSLSGDNWSAALAFPTAAASAAWHGHLGEARAQLDRWQSTLPTRPSGAGSLSKAMIDAHHAYLALLAGGRDRSWLSGATPPPFNPAAYLRIIGSSTFFGLAVEAAQTLEQPETGALLLPYLEDAYAAGQMITTGWPQLIPRLVAAAARLAGDAELAYEGVQQAERLARAGDLTFELGRTHVETARCVAALGRPADAVKLLRSAHRIADDYDFDLLGQEIDQVRC
ncbi:MAG: AAA family ATPase [Actinobacteria bacterium]|nr:AAA family ATPase [Actinomycetota bacterium]